jgi:polyisoprenoid-binding protein YceI
MKMTKSILASFVLLFAISTTSQAQKVYATKTGQIFFNATGGIEKIAAVNNQTDSKFVDNTGQMVFAVLVKGFKFENQLMEDHFNENYMESTKFPKADFKGYITNIKEVNFTKDGSYPVKLEGNLTLHGVTNKVSASGTMKIAGGVPEMDGTFKIKLKDYNVTGLYIGEKIAPEVAITVKCKYQ